jgi:hypothetical protein
MNVFLPDQWSAWDREMRARHDIGKTVLFVRNTSELLDPGPSSRAVFFDTGGLFPALGWQGWGDTDWEGWPYEFAMGRGGPLPSQHSGGTCLSFADGHTDYWRWHDPNTLEWARWVDTQAQREYPATPAPHPTWPAMDNPDYVRVHKAIWGKAPK